MVLYFFLILKFCFILTDIINRYVSIEDILGILKMKFFKKIQDHSNSFVRNIHVRRSKFKGLYIIGLVCIGFLVVVFQNCKSETISTSTTSQEPENPEAPSSLSYEKGQVIAYLSSEGEGMPKDRFDVNADVYLKMRHVHPNADNFKWTITRGFESIVDSQITNQNEYQHRFTQTGSYILFATAHQGSSSDSLTQSIKRIVVGAECHLENILEIELQSGSFTSDSSATLTLRDASDFTDITWKVTLPSREQIFNGATLTIDLTGEPSGPLIIEVSAVDSAGCLVYRKKEIQVTENLQAYINPFQITDDGQDIAVVLENNDIYKYRRPRGNTQILNLDIKNADKCEFQLNNRKRSSINCQGSIDISLSSNKECQRTLVKFWISSGDHIDSSYQYYNYCPAQSGFCYFGSLKESMGQHFCSESIALASTNNDRPGLVSDRSIDGQCDNSLRNGCVTGDADDGVIADTEEFYKWHCVGVNNGETATDCSKRIPINGQCDNSRRNGCLAGQVNDEASEDSTEFYKWHCEGEHEGTTATDCQKDKTLNGACNNNVKNGCSAGTPNPTAVADTDTYYQWHCEGEYGGQNSGTCQFIKPINGQCNNAQRNGCLAGDVDDAVIADTEEFYKWHCEGEHGGTTATDCQKGKPLNGSCNNNAQNECSAGTPNPTAVADTDTHYKWRCDGQYEGQNSETCQFIKPITGQCNNAQRNRCQAGTANDEAVADTNTLYKWRCDGQHGGQNSGACQFRKPINGQCNNSQRNACRVGRANDGAVADTSADYRWRCDGQHGGRSVTCQKKKPINGVCNNARQNTCRTGRVNAGAVADTSADYRWRCDGQHGGRSVTCQKKKPINGVCNNARQNTCRTGRVNAGAVADTSADYRWRCDGQHGGRSVTCQKKKPINGVCNNARQNTCRTGRVNAGAVADTSADYRWRCDGQHGGRSVTCQKKKPINGVCNNARENRCYAGRVNAGAVADTGTLHRWRCDGQHGGRSVTCQKRKPIDGVCNNARPNKCRTGTFRAIADTGTLHRWRCDGYHGGRSVTCQKRKPIDGVCNNARRNKCLKGWYNARAIADTGTLHRWRCDGYHGGRSVTCQKRKPIDGVCNNARRNKCLKGWYNARAIADTSTHHRWRCDGSWRPKLSTCQKRKPPQYQRHTQSITQKDLNKTDILFVLDPSGSVDDLMTKLTEEDGAIDQFIDKLKPSADFRIATILALVDVDRRVSSGRHYQSGQIFSVSNEPKVLSSNSSPSDIRKNLKKKFDGRKILKHLEGDDECRKMQREEMNLKSLEDSIGGTRLTENQRLDFFRPDASLIVIFITDEADVCARYPSYAKSLGYKPPKKGGKNNEHRCEQEGAEEYCTDVTHHTVRADLRRLKGNKLSINGIFDSNTDRNRRREDAHPRKPKKEFAYGVQELVDAFEGIATWIRHDTGRGHNFDHYISDFKKIFNQVNEKIFKLEITLEHRPIVTNRTRVLLQNPGSPSSRPIEKKNWSYDHRKNTISIKATASGRPNAVITVEYYTRTN